MSEFIELTDKKTGEKLSLRNVPIYRARIAPDGSTVLLDNLNQYWIVEESYETVKQLVGDR